MYDVFSSTARGIPRQMSLKQVTAESLVPFKSVAEKMGGKVEYIFTLFDD